MIAIYFVCSNSSAGADPGFLQGRWLEAKSAPCGNFPYY